VPQISKIDVAFIRFFLLSHKGVKHPQSIKKIQKTLLIFEILGKNRSIKQKESVLHDSVIPVNSVADPECLSGSEFFVSGSEFFSIRDPGSKRFPGSEYGSASYNLSTYFLTQKMVSKFSEI
jgi:hypothetical protein